MGKVNSKYMYTKKEEKRRLALEEIRAILSATLTRGQCETRASSATEFRQILDQMRRSEAMLSDVLTTRTILRRSIRRGQSRSPASENESDLPELLFSKHIVKSISIRRRELLWTLPIPDYVGATHASSGDSDSDSSTLSDMYTRYVNRQFTYDINYLEAPKSLGSETKLKRLQKSKFARVNSVLKMKESDNDLIGGLMNLPSLSRLRLPRSSKGKLVDSSDGKTGNSVCDSGDTWVEKLSRESLLTLKQISEPVIAVRSLPKEILPAKVSRNDSEDDLVGPSDSNNKKSSKSCWKACFPNWIRKCFGKRRIKVEEDGLQSSEKSSEKNKRSFFPRRNNRVVPTQN